VSESAALSEGPEGLEGDEGIEKGDKGPEEREVNELDALKEGLSFLDSATLNEGCDIQLVFLKDVEGSGPRESAAVSVARLAFSGEER
jgi:hypothetical protein